MAKAKSNRKFSPKQLEAQRRFAERFGGKAVSTAARVGKASQRRGLRVAQAPARVVAAIIPAVRPLVTVGAAIQRAQLRVAQIPAEKATQAVRGLLTPKFRPSPGSSALTLVRRFFGRRR